MNIVYEIEELFNNLSYETQISEETNKVLISSGLTPLLNISFKENNKTVYYNEYYNLDEEEKDDIEEILNTI